MKLRRNKIHDYETAEISCYGILNVQMINFKMDR